MLKRIMSVVAPAVLVMVFHGETVLAKTVVVGPATCQPGGAHYSTIQAAVNAVQLLSGSTVLVCAGTYPEQVVITSTLILKGPTDGSGPAVITVPAGGLLPNAVSPRFGPVAAQVLVANASTVKVLDIAVNGAGGTCPTPGANQTVGIQYLNVGLPADINGGGLIPNGPVSNQKYGC